MGKTKTESTVASYEEGSTTTATITPPPPPSTTTTTTTIVGNELEFESHLRPSLLSSEAFANTENGYKGFVNLALLLLGVLNFRLVVENLIRYGLLVLQSTSEFSDLIDWRSWPGTIIVVVNSSLALLGVALEQAAFRAKISPLTTLVLQTLFVGFLIVAPCYWVIFFPVALGPGITAMLWSTIIWMKMVSFFHVNWTIRRKLHSPVEESSSSSSSSSSPSSPKRSSPSSPNRGPTKKTTNYFPKAVYEHVRVVNLLRFFVIPSLVYEVQWAQTNRIRWGWLARRITEAIFLSIVIYVLALQYMLPVLQKSVVPLETLDIPQLLERILKLSIPLMYLWLIGFYVVFHLYLNIWAEITYMGDRRFYDAWWNSANLAYFWRTWNLPVHRWMLQNIYKPLVVRGYSSTLAGFVCFFVSAIFHEVVVSVPFRTLKFWAFFAMLSQLPLIFVTKKLFPAGSQTGNILFWCQLVLGLPTCVVMYYAYYVSTLHSI